MNFTDAVEIAGVRTTADGYLVADVRIARTGIQIYAGKEVGRPDLETVRVYRPEEEVFAKDAMASFAYRPVTNDHPAEAVSAGNWKKHSVGNLSGDVARDGEFLRVPMIVMDAAAIADVKAGKRETSCGYTCDLKWESGTSPKGEAYDAVQRTIRGNHLAIVRAGRAGADCRIGDDARDNPEGGPMATKTVTVDGITIETTDQGAQVIEKLQKQLSDAGGKITAAEASIAKHVTDLATKDAEIVTLKKQVEDAKVTPAQLREAGKAYNDTLAAAKKLAPKASFTDAMDVGDIRKTAVNAVLGDAAKGWKDEQVEVSFATLAARLGDAKSTTAADPLREAIKDGKTVLSDAEAHAKAKAGRLDRYATAYQPAAAA